ncbi:MAG: Hpt domain-containing protein [Coriobacteriales bacterium]|jgi:HPt (histidine-containing phosphotransfer) domain-containing protein|nr:Hpt domain-containing protein [Coriobacteriales bacterium]
MSQDNEQILNILNATPIEGVDYADGLSRFGNKAAIYLRIVKSFIKNTPDSLEDLIAVTPETLSDYAVRIHGLKGSCYGISAMKIGDEAKALEMASKASDWATVERDNPTVIAHVRELIAQLQDVVDKVEQSEDANTDQRPLVDAPDRELVHSLLEATRSFDVIAMEQIIKDMDALRYQSDPQLVNNLREQLTNFRYDLIEDKATELLR